MPLMNARVAFLLCLLLGLATPAAACDSDADCGPGGTCIKREKRARGVCYGRQDGAPQQAEVPPGAAPQTVTGERRERAKAWLGDPDALLEEHLPGRETGASCMVTQDCPAGFECVIAGFEGRCVRL